MKGIRYGDNPMYISERLHEKKRDYEIVWLLNKNVEMDIPDYVKRVDYGYWNNMYQLSTSAVWVDSNLKDFGTYKSRKQLYVQTWHGSYGIKKIALDLGKNLPKFDKVLYPFNSKIADVIVSNSKKTSQIYKRAFGYNKKLLEVGSPRNDIFFNDPNEIKNKVFKFFGIREAHILLYAPTFRSDYNMDFFNIDMERLHEELVKKYGGDWYILVRLHPNNLKEAKHIKYNDYVLNASDYSVMQELLVAADVLLTDYSSCMFDYITKPKTCFIYAPDLDKYENDRGNYWRMSELPFPLATTNDELFDNIRSFDNEEYVQSVKKLHELVGSCETGSAADKVADYIIDFVEKGRK